MIKNTRFSLFFRSRIVAESNPFMYSSLDTYLRYCFPVTLWHLQSLLTVVIVALVACMYSRNDSPDCRLVASRFRENILFCVFTNNSLLIHRSFHTSLCTQNSLSINYWLEPDFVQFQEFFLFQVITFHWVKGSFLARIVQIFLNNFFLCFARRLCTNHFEKP